MSTTTAVENSDPNTNQHNPVSSRARTLIDNQSITHNGKHHVPIQHDIGLIINGPIGTKPLETLDMSNQTLTPAVIYAQLPYITRNVYYWYNLDCAGNCKSIGVE
jgi:hypothetical protein